MSERRKIGTNAFETGWWFGALFGSSLVIIIIATGLLLHGCVHQPKGRCEQLTVRVWVCGTSLCYSNENYEPECEDD